MSGELVEAPPEEVDSKMGSDFMFVTIGGSGSFDKCGCVGNVPFRGGYSEMAEWIGPQFKEQGFSRLWMHNPGGQWNLAGMWDLDKTHRENREANAERHGLPLKNTRTMWINQWLLAKMYGCPWADDRELRIFHDRMMADFGAKEICYYFGGPDHASFDLNYQKACLEPFVRFEGASFGFDHIVEVPEFEACAALFKWVQRLNKTARIYVEARPYEDIPRQLLRNVSGTVATAGFDQNHPVGKDPVAQERARKIGEVIRIQDPDENGNYPDPEPGLTLARRGSLS